MPRPPKAKPSAPRHGLFRHSWFGPAALALLTALVYLRSFAVPLHDSDDYVYFFRDARVEHPSLENVWRILTEPFFANFHPLTTLTFALDRAVWGTWVPGFHLTQLAFYIGGVVGLYFLFARLLGWRPGAFVAAAIFATHTIHVESVAWLASRKDVVCLFFYALALNAYVRYAATPRGSASERTSWPFSSRRPRCSRRGTRWCFRRCSWRMTFVFPAGSRGARSSTR